LIVQASSPNVTRIAQMARVAEDAGADAISLVNTFVAMANRSRNPQAPHRQMSRRAVWSGHQAIALRMV